MMLFRWLFITLLFTGQARAQDEAFTDADAASDAEQMQAYHTLLHAAAQQVTSGREAWLLAKGLSIPGTQTTVQDRAMIAALHARADSARNSDPLLLRLMTADTGVRGSAPEQADALFAQLDALDPGNAINTLAVMSLAPKDYADPIYDQRVQEMATASHYRSDFLTMTRASYGALARARDLAALPSESDFTSRASDMAMASATAVSIAAAWSLPGYQHLIKACDISLFPARTDSCQRIAELMFKDADTLMDRMIAVSLLERTVTDPADRARVQVLRQDFDWQLAAFQEISLSRPYGAILMSGEEFRYFATMLHRDEIVAMRDLLAAHSVPLQAPADWQPRK